MKHKQEFAYSELISTLDTPSVPSKRNFYNTIFNYVGRYDETITHEFENGPKAGGENVLPLLSSALLSVSAEPEAVLTKIHSERNNRVSSHNGRVAYLALYTSCAKELVRSPKTMMKWKQNPEITEKIANELVDLRRTLGTIGVDKAVSELSDTKKILDKKQRKSPSQLKFLSNFEDVVGFIKKPFVKVKAKAAPVELG